MLFLDVGGGVWAAIGRKFSTLLFSVVGVSSSFCPFFFGRGLFTTVLPCSVCVSQRQLLIQECSRNCCCCYCYCCGCLAPLDTGPATVRCGMRVTYDISNPTSTYRYYFTGEGGGAW